MCLSRSLMSSSVSSGCRGSGFSLMYGPQSAASFGGREWRVSVNDMYDERLAQVCGMEKPRCSQSMAGDIFGTKEVLIFSVANIATRISFSSETSESRGMSNGFAQYARFVRANNVASCLRTSSFRVKFTSVHSSISK